MIRVVTDTNTAVSGLLTEGVAAVVLRLAYDQHITLWGCPESVTEFRRVIRYPRIEKRIRKLYRGVIAFEREYERLVNIVSIDGVQQGILVPDDRDDEMFVRTAIVASAQYIVTRDPDLLGLGRFQHTLIATPEEFIAAWRVTARKSPAVPVRRRWRLPWRRKS